MGDLPSGVVNRVRESQSLPLDDFVRSVDPSGSVVPLAELEKKAILQAIGYTKGDRTVAAAMLGIGRTTLYRKLREYGVSD